LVESARYPRDNAAHHQSQAERLIKNPRPIFDLMNGVFVTPFREPDIIRFVQRFAQDDAQQAALLERVLTAPELVQLPNGRYTTQGKLAEQARQELQPILQRLDRLPSWAALDKRLEEQGWQLEAANRNERLVFDLVKKADPTTRISAYRVDQRLSPSAAAKRFGESRAKHELRSVAAEVSRPYKQQRDKAWQQHRQLSAAEQERLEQRARALRDEPDGRAANDNRFSVFQRQLLARERAAIAQEQARRRQLARAFTQASKAEEAQAVEQALAAKRLALNLPPPRDTPENTRDRSQTPSPEGPRDMATQAPPLPRHPAELDSLKAERDHLDRELAQAFERRDVEQYKQLTHERNRVTERMLSHPDYWQG
jgi:hypothetical protein